MSDAYRDFLFLDLERVESIIAQLEEGLTTERVIGRSREIAAKADSGISTIFGRLGLSGEARAAREIHENRVFHDFAFAIANELLERKGLLQNTSDWTKEEFCTAEPKFLVQTGELEVYHPALISAASEMAGKILVRPPFTEDHDHEQRRQFKAHGTLLKTVQEAYAYLLGESGMVISRNDQGVELLGLFASHHLRASIQTLIGTYGLAANQQWTMVAMVTNVPQPLPTESADSRFQVPATAGQRGPLGDMVDTLKSLNTYQDLVGGIAYPFIAVSPIAVYREMPSSS